MQLEPTSDASRLADLKQRVLAAARTAPAPTLPEMRRLNLRLALSAVAVPLAMFLAIGGARSGPRPLPLAAGTALGALALAALALWTALGRGGSMLGRARVWLLGVAVAAPLAFLAWKLALSESYPHMMESWSSRPGYRCFLLTAGLGVWPLVAMALARRHSDPTHPRSFGFALGIAAGVAAGALVDLWCPVGHARHVLAGHILPMGLLGLVGLGLGQRLLALRAE